MFGTLKYMLREGARSKNFTLGSFLGQHARAFSTLANLKDIVAKSSPVSEGIQKTIENSGGGSKKEKRSKLSTFVLTLVSSVVASGVVNVVLQWYLTERSQALRDLKCTQSSYENIIVESLEKGLLTDGPATSAIRVKMIKRPDVASLANQLSDVAGVILFTGPAGSGKTTLVLDALKSMSSGSIYLSLRECFGANQPLRMYNTLASILGLNQEGNKITTHDELLITFRKALMTQRSQDKPRPIVFFDHIHCAINNQKLDPDVESLVLWLLEMHILGFLNFRMMTSETDSGPILQKLSGMSSRLMHVDLKYLDTKLVQEYLADPATLAASPETCQLITDTVGAHLTDVVDVVRSVQSTIARGSATYPEAVEAALSDVLMKDVKKFRMIFGPSGIDLEGRVIALDIFTRLLDQPTLNIYDLAEELPGCRPVIEELIGRNFLREIDGRLVGFHAPRQKATFKVLKDDVSRDVKSSLAESKRKSWKFW